MIRRNKINSRVSRFESLENRTLLAGNVTSFVDGGGDLVIQGDAASNTIQLIQTAANTWKVTGIATTVNGGHTYIAPGVTRRIGTFMGQGNNTVQFLGGNSFGIDFEGLNGNDTLILSNLTIFNRVNIDAGNGTNSIVINNCNISDGLGITEGDNNDAVAITRTNINGGLLVELGNGANALTMVNDNILQSQSLTSTIQPDQDEFDVPDCGAFIVGGSGTDVIVMNDVNIDCFTQIDTLGGNDSVAIVNSRFGNLPPAAPFATADVEPNVDDPTLVDPSLNDTLIGLYVETGSGSDAVAITGTKVYGHLDVDTSGELYASHVGLLVTDAKDGNDSVTLNNVQVLDDGKMASQTGDDLDSGELAIYTGNQSDAVVLNAVRTDGFAYIQTTDVDDSSLDGADAVAIANCTFDRLDPGLVEIGIDRFSGEFFFGLAVKTGNGNDAITIANVKVTEATVIETGDGSDHVAVSGLTETPAPTYYSTIYIDLQGGKYNALTIVNSSAENAEFYADPNNGNILVKTHNHFNTETDSGFDTVVG